MFAVWAEGKAVKTLAADRRDDWVDRGSHPNLDLFHFHRSGLFLFHRSGGENE